MTRNVIPLLFALAACKSGAFLTVDVANVPCGTDQLFVTVMRDGATVDHTFSGDLGTKPSTSFVLDLSDTATGSLDVTIEARGAGGTLATASTQVAVPLGGSSVTVDLHGVACSDGDAGIDVDANTCGWSLVPSNIDACALGTQSGAWTASGTFDTTAGTGAIAPTPGTMVTLANGVVARQVYVTTFSVLASTTLTLAGQYPLIVVADTITVDGTIIVRNNTATPADCAASPGEVSTYCTGGGAGGSFGSPGGAGGTCQGVGAAQPQPVLGDASLIPLRGGCPGARAKGTGNLGAVGGGPAGGALQLAARTSLIVNGTIDAGGLGGGGGTGISDGSCATAGCATGGGAGGSGGAILLESPSVAVAGTAKLCANGAGGGGGGANASTAAASSGTTALCADAIAAGGNASGAGGAGGGGGHKASPNGHPGIGVSTVDGGGGGGGGVGRIRIHTNAATPVASGAVVTPAAAP